MELDVVEIDLNEDVHSPQKLSCLKWDLTSYIKEADWL